MKLGVLCMVGVLFNSGEAIALVLNFDDNVIMVQMTSEHFTFFLCFLLVNG